jgi:hypothetical protein
MRERHGMGFEMHVVEQQEVKRIDSCEFWNAQKYCVGL